MRISSIEEVRSQEYVDRTVDEIPFSEWLLESESPPVLLAAEGFEERSVGALKLFAAQEYQLPAVVVGRYVRDDSMNRKYRPEFEKYAELIAPGRWESLENHDDGKWVRQAIESLRPSSVALDITGLSARGLFGALDALSEAGCPAVIVYSEAAEYWPKLTIWEEMAKGLADDSSYPACLAEKADESEWLYGRDFRVELLAGHEGYDVAGTSALVAFLPFKAARLAAVLSQAEYSEYVFIAGRPRLSVNEWRLDALKQINESITRQWEVKEMSTFGYRSCLKDLASLLFSDNSLSYRCDIHLTPMGSKLQSVACWALSRIARSITVVAGFPSRYFPDAYSDGIGESWAFPFVTPSDKPKGSRIKGTLDSQL